MIIFMSKKVSTETKYNLSLSQCTLKESIEDCFSVAQSRDVKRNKSILLVGDFIMKQNKSCACVCLYISIHTHTQMQSSSKVQGRQLCCKRKCLQLALPPPLSSSRQNEEALTIVTFQNRVDNWPCSQVIDIKLLALWPKYSIKSERLGRFIGRICFMHSNSASHFINIDSHFITHRLLPLIEWPATNHNFDIIAIIRFVWLFRSVDLQGERNASLSFGKEQETKPRCKNMITVRTPIGKNKTLSEAIWQ